MKHKKIKNLFYYYSIFFVFIGLYFQVNLVAMNNITNNNNSNIVSPVIEGSWQKTINHNYNEKSIQFNWQQRKILKQKAYSVYSNLNVVIEDINNILDKFNQKIEKINQLLINFESEIRLKCTSLNSSYQSLNDFMNYIDMWLLKINTFKDSIYYTLHKDFRKKIDQEGQNFENIKNMIFHYQNSIMKMINLKNILINSVRDLFLLQEKAIEYEERAWSKYQQLDELISDRIAENNFLEINNYSENAILINTYLRTNFLEFFNQGMVNLNNANSSILSAVDDLINHINATNNFIDSLEKEIQVYEEEKLKEKINLELEEKKKLEENIKLEEEKKIIELKKKKELESTFQYKINYFFMNSLLKIKEFFLLIKNKFIEQGVYYYNIILGNFHSVVKKNNKNLTLLSPVVSEQVAELPPLKNNDQNIVVFSSPNVPGNNQGEPVVLNSDPSANRLGLAMTPPPGETFIEDVFSTVPQPQYHQEKIKLGATSYPNKIAPTQLQSINQSVVADTANQAISILSSEDITPPTTESVAQVDSSVEKKFNYQQLEIKDANVENNQSLLPDLSNLEKQKNSNIQSSVVGVDQGLVNKVFNASGSNTQSRSFKKETRQRNDYKDHKTTSGSLTKKKKKKKKNKT